MRAALGRSLKQRVVVRIEVVVMVVLMHSRAVASFALLLSFVVLVLGCAAPHRTLDLTVSNQTTLSVTVFVNDGVLINVPPGDVATTMVSGGVSEPWTVEARTPSGRVLSSMTVRPGDVSETTHPDGSRSARGAAIRVDLSCGRLDMWSGPPLLGPMPGPGKPGDCDP